jgi:Family of unknown function (DUF6884)/GIY-YIG catalytic domain
MAMSVWSMLEECVGQLDEPFRRSEIVGWFRRHYPDVKESTLAAHIQAATANSANRAQNHPWLGARAPLLQRVDHGLYVRAPRVPTISRPEQLGDAPRKAANVSQTDGVPGVGGDIVLIGCVRTKRSAAAPAADLFDSPLFAGRRRYAISTGKPWYILSAKYGLLAPDDVIGPYDLYLPDQSPGYRRAWGEFVVAQLAQLVPNLQGRVIEVHAGAAYVEPLRRPLVARGASVLTPLTHLGLGEQLAWYARGQSSAPGAVTSAKPAPPPLAADADELVRALTDRSKALSPAELLNRGSRTLMVPGLYTWWVDQQGSVDLSAGLGHTVRTGLIYAGQAGATRWPSGKSSGSTLWTRIAGMHLVGAAEFSTFRRSLAAILSSVLGLVSENDPQLSVWINAHLTVVTVPVPDADRLGEIESTVLDALDPPLNLRGRRQSAVRERLSELRRSAKR